MREPLTQYEQARALAPQGLPEGLAPQGLPEGLAPQGLPEGLAPQGLPEGLAWDGLPEGLARHRQPGQPFPPGTPASSTRGGSQLNFWHVRMVLSHQVLNYEAKMFYALSPKPRAGDRGLP
jgi:hypothetical protein